jgi:hypothetical protein
MQDMRTKEIRILNFVKVLASSIGETSCNGGSVLVLRYLAPYSVHSRVQLVLSPKSTE